MDYYIGLDLGTTGMKGVLTDSELNVRKRVAIDSPMIQKGKTREFGAEDFCDRAVGLIRELARCAGAGEVKALAAASASGNTLFLDENDQPIGYAISWTDRRIQGEDDLYFPGFDLAGVHEKIGWPYIGMFPLAHIAWVKKERPDIWIRCKTVCMSTEYLLHELCGNWGTDPSTATPFYLVDQLEREYSPEYMRYFGLESKNLPPVCPSKAVLGKITKEASGRTGLTSETKIVLGSFDHPACARGMGALLPGDLLFSCGTSWAGLFVAEDRARAIRAGLLVDPYLQKKGLWACMFAMTQYGEKIDEAVRTLIDKSDKRFETLNILAKERADCGRDLSLLGDGIRGDVWNTLGRAQAAYGIMQAACADAQKGIGELKEKGFSPERIFMAGGPAKSEVWPQVMADTLKKDVYCLHGAFGGAVGAALIAAIGDGKYTDEAEFFASRENRYIVYRPV